MALVPLARIASAPTASTQPQGVVRLQAGNATQGMQMAQAIGQVGGVALQLQEKYAELNDTRNLIEAENVMRAKTQEFNTWRMDPANADESKWLPRWQEMQNETQKFVDGLKITDRARLGLSRSFGKWADGQTISVQGDAFKQGVRRTGTALQLRVQQAEAAGDDALVSSSYDQAAKLGVMLPEEAELAKYESLQRSKATRRSQQEMQADAIIKNQGLAGVKDANAIFDNSPDWTPEEKANKKAGTERAAEFENLTVLATDNPRMAKELAMEGEKAGRISAPQRIRIIDAADSTLNGLRASKVQNLAARIKNGDIPSPDELKQDQDITDLDRMALVKMATEIPANDGETFQRAITEIDSYRPRPGDDLAKAQFEVFLESNFSGPYLDGLKTKWAEKTSSPTSTVETAEAFQSLDKWAFDDERLGKYKEPVLDKDGKMVLKKKDAGYYVEPGIFWGQNIKEREDTYEPVMKIDPAKRDLVAKSVSDIKETIRHEVKEGKLTDSTMVSKRMAELAKMPLATKAASEADPRLNGLPTSVSGSPSSPAFLPAIDISDILKRHATNPGK
jgi:hypothetical protein